MPETGMRRACWCSGSTTDAGFMDFQESHIRILLNGREIRGGLYMPAVVLCSGSEKNAA
jgi:hypothetical protein